MGSRRDPPVAGPVTRRFALVVAHPGHELRVHGWLCATRPRVFVLTDGSGRTGVSRLGYTSRILDQARAEPAALYGRFTDQAIYDMIMRGDAAPLGELVQELAAALVDGAVTDVVGDAAEGYNPAHDLCRLLINAAVDLARRRHPRVVRNFAFPLIGAPDGHPDARGAGAIRRHLDDAALARKLATARAYVPLRGEVDAALAAGGPEAFRRECLRPVDEAAGGYDLAERPPFYERYGEQQVAAGHYRQVLRYRDHMVPVAEALGACVERRRASSVRV